MKYHRVNDKVTERIIQGFDDFEGWTDDTKPLSRHAAKGQAAGEFEASILTDEPPIPTERVAVFTEPPPTPIAPAGHDGLECPSCHCLLPDPNHMVTSGSPDLMDAMRVSQGIKPKQRGRRKPSMTNTEDVVVTGGML